MFSLVHLQHTIHARIPRMRIIQLHTAAHTAAVRFHAHSLLPFVMAVLIAVLPADARALPDFRPHEPSSIASRPAPTEPVVLQRLVQRLDAFLCFVPALDAGQHAEALQHASHRLRDDVRRIRRLGGASCVQGVLRRRGEGLEDQLVGVRRRVRRRPAACRARRVSGRVAARGVQKSRRLGIETAQTGIQGRRGPRTAAAVIIAAVIRAGTQRANTRVDVVQTQARERRLEAFVAL